MLLMAVQPCEEHQARLVEARRRGKDVAREWHGRGEDVSETFRIALRKVGQRRGSGGGDRNEGPEQSGRKDVSVALAQPGVVEVVAPGYPHMLRQASSHKHISF